MSNNVSSWIKCPERYAFFQKGDNLFSFPATYMDCLDLILAKAHVVQAGVWLATVKGKDVLPSAALALCVDFDKKTFPQVNLTWKMATSFLSHGSLILENAPKGWCLLCYDGLPLGWAKNLGNRVNNAFPAEWRMRIAPSPDDYRRLIFFEF